MTLTLIGFGIGFVVGSFLVLSLVCIHMARKHGETLASKFLRPEVKLR
jgi:hypothetical protein